MAQVIPVRSVQDWQQEHQQFSMELKAMSLRTVRWWQRLNRFLERIHGFMTQSIRELPPVHATSDDRRYDEFGQSFQLLNAQIGYSLRKLVDSPIVVPLLDPAPESQHEDEWRDYVDDIQEVTRDWARQLEWEYRARLLDLVELMDTVERVNCLTFPMPTPEDEAYYDALRELELRTQVLRRSLRNSLSARGVSRIRLERGDYPPVETTRVVSRDVAGVKDMVIGQIVEKGYYWKGQLLRKAAVLITVREEGR